MKDIARLAETDPDLLHKAPQTTPADRPDEVKAATLAEHFAAGSRDPGARTDAFFDPAGQDDRFNITHGNDGYRADILCGIESHGLIYKFCFFISFGDHVLHLPAIVHSKMGQEPRPGFYFFKESLGVVFP